MHSIAFFLLGGRYRYQVWGPWHHYNVFTLSKKKTHFHFFEKITAFWAPRFFEIHGLHGLLGAKSGVCQVSKLELWRGSWFLFWNAGPIKIRRNRPFLWSGLPIPSHSIPSNLGLILAGKGAKPAFKGTLGGLKTIKISFLVIRCILSPFFY